MTDSVTQGEDRRFFGVVISAEDAEALTVAARKRSITTAEAIGRIAASFAHEEILDELLEEEGA